MGGKNIGYMMERASRLARYDLLRRMFLEVEDDYELVERGTLLSVYRRRDGL